MSSKSFIALLSAALSFAPACATVKNRDRATAPVADVAAAKCHELMAALAAGNGDAAEKDFDATMRSKLPPPILISTWRSLQARYGAFSSWRVGLRDHEFGKDRFTLELTLGERVMYLLVVFEPPTTEIIGLFFSAAPLANAAPNPAPANPNLKETPVSVGPLGLGGSLTLPTASGGTLLPAAILVAGSGPNNRDEELAHVSPLRDLAFSLAELGIITLRYDKRTFAHPESFTPSTTVEQEVIADAVAALELLRARPEVDPHRLFVIGHSLGAQLAPEIAKRGGGVAGLVLLAAPGRPGEEILLEQLRNRGASARDIASLEARVRALPRLPASDLVMGVPAGYWRDLDRRDEPALAVELARPVLLLRGSLDHNVAAVDQDRWLSALSGRVPVEAVTLPGLDHLFIANGHGAAGQHVSPEVSQRIAAFARATPPS